MIWSDPWVELAMQKGGTTLPPPPTPLAIGRRFQCMTVAELDLEAWIDLVGTRWTRDELVLRLQGAWIPCLFQEQDLVATCVLRPKQKQGIWILETLRARRQRDGFCTALLRAVIPWIFAKVGGPFSLGYTWELSLPSLVAAWLKGWLKSAIAIQYGWALSLTEAGCSFCPTTQWSPIGPRLALPTLFQDKEGTAVVSDSGLCDGWGYVSLCRGSPDWSAIAKKGGWRSLWMRSRSAPSSEWVWTGEIVVVGCLNYDLIHPHPSPIWVTAEIASG